MRPIRKIGKVIGVMIVVVLAAMLFGYIVMRLWNWLVPTIFHSIGVITFWQAVGLLVLIRILFHGVGGGHRWRRRGGDGGWDRHHGWDGWNHRMQGGPWGYWKEKWESMTPEEREKTKAEWKGNWREMRNKWHNMSAEEKAKMKAHLRDRCRPWGEGMPGFGEEKPGDKEANNPE